MRTLLLPAALVAAVAALGCGPKVAPKGTLFDEDLSSRTEEPREVTAPVQPRPEAPPGKGLRTGTIQRARLVAVLDGGPGAFLRQLEIAPRMDGQRFVGWQLVQLLDRTGPLYDVDVMPGDVLLAINGKPLARPDNLHVVWSSLRTANEVRAQLWRGDAKLELAFAIEPALDPALAPALDPALAPAPAPAPDKAQSAKPRRAPGK